MMAESSPDLNTPLTDFRTRFWRPEIIKQFPYFVTRSRESIIGIATGYGLRDQGVGVRVTVGARIFTSSRRLDRHLGPPNLLSIGYRGLFPRGLSGWGVKLTTHLQLVPRSRKCVSIHPLPPTSSWLVLSWLCTGTTLPLPYFVTSQMLDRR
jgi:hypothetical protein